MIQIIPAVAKILVVDEELLPGFRQMIEKAGYQLAGACRAAQALGWIHQFRPDMVFLDINLSGAEGLEMLKRLKADPEFQSLFVAIFSAHPIPSDMKAAALENGADGCFLWPLPEREFLALVESFLRQKKSVDALRTSQDLFANSFEFAPIGMALVAPQGQWLKVNRALCELVGYPAEELLQRTFQDITHPEDLRPSLENMRKLVEAELNSYQMEKRFFHSDGRTIRVRSNVSLVRNGEGAPLYFIAQIQDITDQKRIEEELRFKNAFLEAQTNSSADGLVVFSPQGIKILQNRPFLKIFKVPRAIAEDQSYGSLLSWILGQVQAPEQCRLNFEYLQAHPDATSRDELELRDGTVLERFSAPVTGDSGHFYGRIWAFRNVTERKCAERKVELALRREVVLRRELHHRVKNNLQVIISLLYLQSVKVGDPTAQGLLRESQNRVRSMALIHEMLYQKEDPTSILFSDYVRQLGADLLLTYRLTREVELQVDSQGLHLSIQAAIPCGIIITELITNALKHAFPSGRRGRIEVFLETGPGENTLTLCVRDNGIGFPEHSGLARVDSMGLNLVRDLSQQLGGSLSIGPGPFGVGSETRIVFPSDADPL
jgi:PAS domain S-box-containing protein